MYIKTTCRVGALRMFFREWDYRVAHSHTLVFQANGRCVEYERYFTEKRVGDDMTGVVYHSGRGVQHP